MDAPYYTRVMFHATHKDNVTSIMNTGLSPEFARGKRRAIWITTKNGIQSSILHAASRHHWYVEDIVVIAVLCETSHIKYSGNGMFFYSEHIAVAQSSAPASSFLEENENGV